MLGGLTFKNGSARVLTAAWSSHDGIDSKRSSLLDDHGMYVTAASINYPHFYFGRLGRSRQPDEHIEHISNLIWNSSDGAAWSVRLAAAAWDARIGAKGLQVNAVFWILSGKTANDADAARHRSDVWRSLDGLARTRVAPAAVWSLRTFHCAVGHHGRLMVLGGGDWDARRGSAVVWSSANGVDWQRHPDSPWHGRIWHSCMSYAGRLWLIGRRLLNSVTTVEEIWSTVDGTAWTQ